MAISPSSLIANSNGSRSSSQPRLSLTPQQAQRLFDVGSFLVLNGLDDEPGAEFGVDGHLWEVRQDGFQGVKFLPEGLHLFVYSVPPATSSITGGNGEPGPGGNGNPFGAGIIIRKAILRFTHGREVLLREYSSASEEVEIPAAVQDAAETSASVISPDHLRTLDPKLAPYPLADLESWKALTSAITPQTLATVFGSAADAEAKVDGLTSCMQDELEGDAHGTKHAQATEKQQWGKKREATPAPAPAPADVGDAQADATMEGSAAALSEPAEAEAQAQVLEVDAAVERAKDTAMRFITADLKRSWRRGAVGEEVSRNSRDKSWLLGNVIEEQLGGEEQELIAQFQLAFLLLTQLHNFSALTIYKLIVSLLCRSVAVLQPATSPSPTSSLPVERSLPLYTAFLQRGLLPHLQYLRTEFFDADLPGLDNFLQDEFAALRLSLRAARRQYAGASPSPGGELFSHLERAWESVRATAQSKFGWTLGGLTQDGWDDLRRSTEGKTRIEYNLLVQGDEEDEYTEEGEDAPVVVET